MRYRFSNLLKFVVVFVLKVGAPFALSADNPSLRELERFEILMKGTCGPQSNARVHGLRKCLMDKFLEFSGCLAAARPHQPISGHTSGTVSEITRCMLDPSSEIRSQCFVQAERPGGFFQTAQIPSRGVTYPNVSEYDLHVARCVHVYFRGGTLGSIRGVMQSCPGMALLSPATPGTFSAQDRLEIEPWLVFFEEETLARVLAAGRCLPDPRPPLSRDRLRRDLERGICYESQLQSLRRERQFPHRSNGQGGLDSFEQALQKLPAQARTCLRRSDREAVPPSAGPSDRGTQ